MAKATKSHSDKRNHRSAEAWADRKKRGNITGVALQLQKIYRINALRQRAAENHLTEKNVAELARLGI